MKTLTLFRHAKSGWDSPVSRDFDRPINQRGLKSARIMGAYLRDAAWRIDHIVSSPAIRCTETLEAFWEGFGRILHPVWDRRVYLASGDVLLDVVNELPDSVDRAMICGHNPGLEDLIFLLVPDVKSDVLRDQVEAKFPTASVAELEVDVDRWADVKEQAARFTRFIPPRDLDPTVLTDPD